MPTKSICFSLLTIGDELLRGSTINTNAAFLAKELTLKGYSLSSQVSCSDDISDIQKHLSFVLADADIVIMTGGLGPTPDDKTRDALADYLGEPLVFSQKQYAMLKKIYKKYQKKINPLARRECLYPKSAHPLVNRFGIALGFYIRQKSKMIFVLPGVPSELEKMFIHDVSPILEKKFPRPTSHTLHLALTGISEPDVISKLGKNFFKLNFDFGIYPSFGELKLYFKTSSKSLLMKLKKHLKLKLSPYIYSWDHKTLSEVVHNLLLSKKKSISIAESCTGGLLADSFIQYSGSSHYFKAGETVYSSQAKTVLGVSSVKLKRFGEVSPQVAKDLADSVRNKFSTSYGVGVTGIAGPGGASRNKPVGLVFIGISTPSETKVFKHIFWGNRAQVRARTVQKVHEYLFKDLS